MRSFLSLFTKLSFHTAPVVRALRTSARIERISERVLVFQAREARFVPYKRAFSSVYVLLLHIERMRLLKTTTTTPYVYAHIYEESTGDVARLRGGEKAERSEESALFKLLSGCFCFFCFMFYYVSSVSLSRVLLLSFASLAQEYYYYSLRTPSLLGRADSTELIKTVFSP